MALENDTQAPDFELPNQFGEHVRLHDFRGKKPVALVFFPLAFSSTCTGELCALRDDLSVFQNDKVQVLTISVDSPYAHKIFAEREGYDFPLLADFWPHGAVAEAYGVFNEAGGMADRGTFLIDTDGVIRYTEHNSPGEGREPQGWRDAIKALVG